METQPRFNREDLLTPDEVAKILRVQRTTALNYMRRGVDAAEPDDEIINSLRRELQRAGGIRTDESE